MTEFQPDKGTNGNFMKLRFMFDSTGGETIAHTRDCKYFDGCSAPMCPRDTDVSKTVWFAGEDICRLHDVPEWVKRHGKIAKKGINATAGYFTLAVLERHCVIGKKKAVLILTGPKRSGKKPKETGLISIRPLSRKVMKSGKNWRRGCVR